MLHRYWFEFEEPANGTLPMGVRVGCGVTAHDYADGVSILRQHVFVNGEIPPMRRVVEDIDVATLDPQHVIPNMGVVVTRGIWYPLGYDRE